MVVFSAFPYIYMMIRYADDLSCCLVSLPASYVVWAASPEADFISGRFLWVHWDVNELRVALEKKKDDPCYLRVGIEGFPSFPV